MKRRKSLKTFLTFATLVDLLPLVAIALLSAAAFADPSPTSGGTSTSAQLDDFRKAVSSAATSLNAVATSVARLEAQAKSAQKSGRKPAATTPAAAPSAAAPSSIAPAPASSAPTALPDPAPGPGPGTPAPTEAAPTTAPAAAAPAVKPSKAPSGGISSNKLADDPRIAGYTTPTAPPAPAKAASVAGPAGSPGVDDSRRDSINNELDRLTSLPVDRAAPASLDRHQIRPAPVAGARPSGSSSTDPSELTLGDIRKSHIFSGFNAAILGRDPNSVAVLRGTVFANCAGYFQFDSGQTRTGDLGFIIRDPGGHGRACVKEGQRLGYTCANTKCLSLSHLDGTHIPLARAGDVRIGLLHENPELDDDDPNKIAFEDLGLRPHVSARTMIARRRQLIQDRKQAQIDRLRWEIAHCRQTSDQILQDHSELELLRDLTHMSEAQFNTMDKDLKIAEFNLLKKRAAAMNVKNLDRDKLDQLLDDLTDFASNNEGFSDATAEIERNLALRITQQNGTNPSAWQAASDILGEASGLPNLDDKWQQIITTSQTQVSVGKVTAMAISPKRDDSVFVPAYESLMNSVMEQLNSSCFNASGASAPQLKSQAQDCQMARTSYTSAMQIPQVMMQAQQQRIQAQRQRAMMQLQMQQSLMYPTGSSAMANPMQPNLAGVSGTPPFTMPTLAPGGGLTSY